MPEYDDLDDDIFNDDIIPEQVEPPAVEATGTVTANGEINGLDFLPEEVKRKIGDLLRKAGVTRDSQVSITPTNIVSKLVVDFFNFVAMIDDANPLGPIVFAQAEAMDPKFRRLDTGVRDLWEVHEAERHLIATHNALKSLNDTLADAENNNANYVLLNMMRFMVAWLFDRNEVISIAYRDFCQKVDMVPDEAIIKSGTYSTEDRLRQVCMIDNTALEILNQRS